MAKKIELNPEAEQNAEPKTNLEAEQKPAAEAEQKRKNPGKKYYKVRFHERQSTTEPVNVTLGVNGNILVIQRGQVVILPEEYVELARSCVIRYNYPSLDGRTNVRKKFTMPRCSFDLLGEATEKEYLRMKREGTEKTLKDLEKNIQE